MPRDHLGQFNMSSGLQFARGVLLLDDCEGTCNWAINGAAGEYSGDYSTASAFVGLKGLELSAGIATPLEDDWVGAGRSLEFPHSGLLVVRAKMAYVAVATVKTVHLFVDVYDGVNVWRPAIKVTPNTPKAEYRDDTGGYVEMAALALEIGGAVWTTFELVLDLKGMGYVSCRYGGVEVDLAGVGLYTSGADTARKVDLGLMHYCSGANEAKVYWDGIYAGEFLYV